MGGVGEVSGVCEAGTRKHPGAGASARCLGAVSNGEATRLEVDAEGQGQGRTSKGVAFEGNGRPHSSLLRDALLWQGLGCLKRPGWGAAGAQGPLRPARWTRGDRRDWGRGAGAGQKGDSFRLCI